MRNPVSRSEFESFQSRPSSRIIRSRNHEQIVRSSEPNQIPIEPINDSKEEDEPIIPFIKNPSSFKPFHINKADEPEIELGFVESILNRNVDDVMAKK